MSLSPSEVFSKSLSSLYQDGVRRIKANKPENTGEVSTLYAPQTKTITCNIQFLKFSHTIQFYLFTYTK